MKQLKSIVDLAAEKGGNCKLTVADEKIVTKNEWLLAAVKQLELKHGLHRLPTEQDELPFS